MKVPPFQLPRRHFDALSRGGGGTEAMRALVASRRSRTTQLIRFIVGARPQMREAFAVLQAVQQAAPEAVRRVLDDPSVGRWATRTAVQLSRGEPACPEKLACVVAAAALRAEVPVRLSLPTANAVWLPSVGTVPAAISGEVDVDVSRVAGHPIVPLSKITVADGAVVCPLGCGRPTR
jgi:HEXXH motif-containing protein